MADQRTSNAGGTCSGGETRSNSQDQTIFELELQLAAANAEIMTANEAKNRAEKQVGALRNTVSFLRAKEGNSGNNRGGAASPARPQRTDNAPAASSSAALTPTRKRKCATAADEAAEAENNAEIARLNSEVDQLKKDARNMRRQLDDKAQECSAAQEKVADMRGKLECVADSETKLIAETTDLMNKLREKEQAQEANEKIISELRDKAGRQSNVGLLKPKDEEIQDLKKELAEVEGRLNDDLRKVENDEVYIQNLKKRLADADAKKKSNADLLKIKDDEIKALKKSLTDAKIQSDANAQAREGALKKTEDALRAETRKKRDLQEEIQDLKAEVSELSSKKATAFSFPRITADMNVSILKAEAKERGLKAGSANAMKKGELLAFLEVGTIHLAEVKRIMKVEKDPEAEAARLAAERRQKEEKSARQKEARERKAAEKKHNDALLTKKITAHSCPLGPTNSLMIDGSTRSNRLKSFLQCDAGHCQNTNYLSPEQIKAPEWSCIKCNYDICAFCLDIVALPEEEQRNRLAALADEKSRALREKWAWARDFPSQITDPTMPTKAKRRFAVMSSRGHLDRIQVGDYEYDSDVSKQFDSAFESLDNANLRAQFVFYCKNRFDEDVEVFGETRSIEKDVDEDGMLVLSTESDWGNDGWKVFVVDYSEYEERLKEQKKEIQRYMKLVERKKEQKRKAKEEEGRKKKEYVEALRRVLDAPAKIKNPPKSNRDRSKGKGFTVLKTSIRGRRDDSRCEEFDSSFKTKADANLRARYLCYVEDHPWGEDRLQAEDLSDFKTIFGLVDKVVDGMVDIEYNDEDYGGTYTFAVLPDDAFRFVVADYDRNAHNQSLPNKKELEKLPAKLRKPTAASANSKSKKKYTVWTSCGYGYDGFHAYEGPPSKQFFASFDSLEDANSAAEYKFFVGNPWGFRPDDDDTMGEFSQASKMNCVVYSVEPEGSECWTVGVAPSSAFHHLEDAVGSTSCDQNFTATAAGYHGGVIY